MAIIDDIQKWVTLAGAVIAAGASSWNMWTNFRENTDKIKVRFGALKPPIDPGYALYIINKSNHPIHLKDYGFIDESGKLLSLPQLFTDEPESQDHVLVRGKSFLASRGEMYEIGPIVLRDQQSGAFAITAEQKRYTLGFRNDVSLYKRLWIMLNVWWKPKYQ